jgi:hypothetical protein
VNTSALERRGVFSDIDGESPSIFLFCNKSLYLDRHRPVLRVAANPELEALWASGHEVGAGSP